LQRLGIEQILQLRCVRGAIGEANQRLKQIRRVGIGELIGVYRHKPRQQLVGVEGSASEGDVGENLAQRLVRARSVVVVRVGEIGGGIGRQGSYSLPGGGGAGDDPNLWQKTEDPVVKKNWRRPPRQESEGGSKKNRLEQRPLIGVGPLLSRRGFKTATGERV